MQLRRKSSSAETSASQRLSKRRLVENEAILTRKANEKVQKAVENTFDAKQRANLQLHFYCECSNFYCTERITLTPGVYKKIHRNRRHFIVMPGHESKSEVLVEETSQYFVIEKRSFVRGLLKNPLSKVKTN